MDKRQESKVSSSKFNELGLEEKIAAFINSSPKQKPAKPINPTDEPHLFSLAVELSLDGVVIGDVDGYITYVNNAALKMFGGLDKKDAIGRHVIEFVAERDRAKVAQRSLTSSLKLDGMVNEFFALKKTGEEFPVEVTTAPIKNSAGKQIGFIDILRDITDRKKVEDALRRSEKKYRLLFENMQNGFVFCQILFDDAGKPVELANFEFNKAFERSTGLSIRDFAEENCKETTARIMKAYPTLFNLGSKVASTGVSHRFELQFNGAWFSIFIFSPQKGYLGLFLEDITEQKKLYQKIEEYSESLEQIVEERTKALREAQDQLVRNERLAAIGELAGMVGHDLRNPLTGIKNAAYLLRKKQSGNMDDRSLDLLGIIDRSVDSANKIINDLLDYSRELRLEFEEYSPKSLINYLLISNVKIPKNIILSENVQSFPMIWVDVGKIERVFLNLISNAVESMPNGGKLEITSKQNGAFVDISFTDTGYGMPEEVQLKIFKPLFTTKAKGMGFGLTICKRIVEAHGGKITVKSTPTKGSTFTVSLPIEQKQN
ncbi:MAG: PAS domain S-box protein [Candidatus Bathyarchaeota archaeon]|nr:PAS domain S-box protein [Candidatus Bathyarchaeota archaeon]